MKNSVEGLNGNFELIEEKKSVNQNRLLKIMQYEVQREKKMKEN